MAQASGYAVLPMSISLQSIHADLAKQLVGPAQKAAKQAGAAIEKGIGDGAEQASKNVEKANFRVLKSTQELETAESKLSEQKFKAEAANKAVETAARKRADAEGKGIDAIEKAEQDLLKKRAAAEREVRNLTKAEEGVEKALSESARATKSLADRQGELDQANQETEKSSKGVRDRLREMGDEAGETGGMFDGLVGKIGGVVGALAGVASVGMFAAMGKELSGEISQINRELGLTGDAASVVGDQVKVALKSGVAAGAEDAASAIGALESQFSYLGFEGEQTSGELADNFMALARTFDVDVAEASQLAGQMIKHNLAPDVEGAADLMTTALQRVPEAMRGETIDAMTEYGTNFANLGFTGEEAFSLIVGAADQGQYAIDKTGDAIKEFSVLAIDPAKAEAFEAIGENSEAMATSVAAGGESARLALEHTAAALLDIEDPGKRAALAVELFGAPIEDLGIDKIPAFLENLTGMEDGMAGAEGASQALADQMANSLDGRMNALKGTVQALAGDAFMWVWDLVQNDLIPAFKELSGWAQDNEKWLTPLAVAVGGMAAGMTAWGIATKGYAIAQGLATGAFKLFDSVTKKSWIGLLVTAVVGLVGAFIWFFRETELGQEIWSNFTGALVDGWDWVTDKVGGGIDWIVEKFEDFTGWISDAWDGITSLFKGDFTSELSDAFGIEEDNPAINFFFTIRDAIDGVKTLISDVGDYISGVWDILFKGDYTGLPFGLDEDSGLVDFFFNIREAALKAGEIIGNVWDWIVDAGKIAVAVIGTLVLTPLMITWNALSALWEEVYEHVIKPVFDDFAAVATWLWESVLSPTFTWIGDKWNELSGRFQEVWAVIKEFVFDAFNWYVDRVKANWELVTGAIVGAWTWVSENFALVWELIKTLVFDAFNWYIDRVKANWELVATALSDSWTWVKDTFIAIWELIKTLVFDAWNSNTLGVKTTFEGVATALSDSWTWVRDQFSSVWDWIRDNVFAKFSSTVDLMRSGAETAMDGIGRAFDWLREKTAKPVNFVIREVYMGGIRPAWGAVASLVGLDDLPRVNEIGGFAQGGVLPGWSPGVDDHLFYSPTGGRIALSGGEAIMRPEWTRAVGGPAAVERMNKAARSGNIPVERHGSESAAFARGGVFDLGAFNAGGVIGAMINIVSQKYPGLTMTSGARPGQGGMHGAGLATDWSNGSGNTPMQLALAHDIAQTYPGSAELIYDSPGWSGNIKNGANVGPFGQFYTMAQAGAHHHHVHWGMTTPPTMPFGGGVFEGGSDGGGGGIWQSITGMVKGLWDNIIDKIPGYGGADNEGLMGKMPGAWLSTVAGSAWDFIKSKADQIMQMAGGSAGSVDIDGITGPVVDQVEQVFAKHGFTGAEWDAAKWIVQKESNWNPTAVNPSSGAFGLFQFNPMGGDTLGTYLPSRSTDPAVQGDAGARYIKDRYGTPTAAKAFWENNQWYDEGGYLQPGTTVVQNDTGKPEPVFNPAQWATLKRMVGNMPFIGESMQVVAKELRTAFDGGDWGYGELAHVLRNEVWAKAIVDGAATLGVISRDTDFMAANAELQQTAADAGRGFLEAQATSLLDVVGLGGLVSMGSSLWDEHGDQAVSTAHSLFGATQNPDTVATASFMGQRVTLEFNAESLDDVVRIGDLKAQADRIDGLEVQLNTKRRPPAGMVTRGGAM